MREDFGPSYRPRSSRPLCEQTVVLVGDDPLGVVCADRDEPEHGVEQEAGDRPAVAAQSQVALDEPRLSRCADRDRDECRRGRGDEAGRARPSDHGDDTDEGEHGQHKIAGEDRQLT